MKVSKNALSFNFNESDKEFMHLQKFNGFFLGPCPIPPPGLEQINSIFIA